ncbi:recombinase family protein [Erwinia sp.]|uniref:recombinase family protein n=1 Tax=Erwinia citreus TaxID=558 RepID=UPI003C71408B
MKYFYVRASTTGQTVTQQVSQLEQHYGKADAVFSDIGVSGTVSTMNRDGFKEMFNLLQTGDSVHVIGIDRLGRSSIDVLTTVESLSKKSVSVMSQREGVDFGTSMGKMILGVISSMAQLERDMISERTKAKLSQLKSEGVKLGKPVSEAGVKARELLSEGVSVADVMSATGIGRAMAFRIKKSLAAV